MFALFDFWSRSDSCGLSLCYFPFCKLLIQIHANYHCFYQQTNCSIFSLESLLMQVSMLMHISSFLIQNSLRAHIFPCFIITPVPSRIILVPIRLYFSVRHFLSKIFYVGVYCSLGTDHSNSSMRTKYSTLMSTGPLVCY